MPKATAGARDASLLYAAQRLGENPSLSPTRLYNELRADGRGYRKSDFLKDVAGLTGKPQTVKPSAIKGGYLSGVARRADVKALPKDQQQAVKDVASAGIDAIAQTGEPAHKKLKFQSNGKGVLTVSVDQEIEDIEDLDDEEEIADSANLADLSGDAIQAAFGALDSLYDKLT